MRKLVVFIAMVALLIGGLWPLQQTNAQSSAGLRVTRVPGVSELPAEFYGVDYPAGATPVISSNGYLTISSGGTWIAVWAPGQWARIEVLQ